MNKSIEVEAHIFKPEITKLVIDNALKEIESVYPGKVVEFAGVRPGDDGGLVVCANVTEGNSANS